jgi:hypothetical protein
MRRIYLSMTIFSTLAILLWAERSGDAQVSTVDFDSPRPLRDALSKVEDQFKITLIFEEVPYVNSSELATAPESNRKYPRGGRFQVQIQSDLQDGYLLAQDVLAAYRHSGLPGTYKVAQKNKMVEVLPLQYKSSSGSMTSASPVLRSRISFPAAPRSIANALQVFVESLSKASGKKVYVWNPPMSSSPEIEFGADNEPADDVLARFNEALGGITAHLTYDPGDPAYYLNLQPILAGPPEPPAQPQTAPLIKAPNPLFVKEK